MLAGLVRAGESETVEFKRSTAELDAAVQTVGALLNGGRGGHVLFGVSNAKRIVGQEVSDDTLKRIANALRSRIDPSGPVRVDCVELANGKALAVVEVEPTSGLYYVDGQPFERIASTTRRMSASLHQHRLMEHLHSSNRWETQPASAVGVDDLDTAEIVRTVDESVRRQRMSEPGTRDVRELLLGMRLLDGGTLLNGAVVLFGRSEALPIRYPQCVLRLARFRGVKANEFLDNRQEIGNIFELLAHADRFLLDHVPVASRIVPEQLERIDEPLYPPIALREALINAFAHRDYALGGGSVSIAMFDDRLEITSVGPLHFNLKVEDLLKPHPSRPWNPTIADVLYRRGLIEKWGGGTLRMAEASERAGTPAPEFFADHQRVTVTFRAAGYVAPSRISHDLSPLQCAILDELARSGRMPLSAIIAAVGEETSERTVQDNLQLLRSLGLVRLIGKRNAYRWELADV
jgi:ATP-dependent DNA helicase RecG